jgi:hypothetical protein
MYTEEQAKKLWCPKAMVLEENGADMTAGNRNLFPDNDHHSSCLASGCAAWRWMTGPTEGQPRQGYCGLAGAT